MLDFARKPRRSYYADFEVRERVIVASIISGIVGAIAGVLIGWRTA